MDHPIVHLQSDRWTLDQPIFGAAEIWAILTFLSENGHQLDGFLDASGLERASLFDPSVRSSLSMQMNVHRAARDTGISALFVRVGRRLHLSTFGVPGFAVLSSPTVGAALSTMVRFAPLLGFKMPLRLEHNQLTRITLDPPPNLAEETVRQFLALDLTKLLTFLRDMMGPGFTPDGLHAAGLDAATERLIGEYAGVSIDHGESGGGVVSLQAEMFSRQLMHGNLAANRRAVEECERLIAEFRAQTDLRFLILERLRQLHVIVPNSARIAADLGMSDRTLRRRLGKMGTSFSSLLDEQRADLAKRYLCKKGMTTEDVAELLGYSDAANFRHAFKRWTGKAPRSFRTSCDVEAAPDRASSPPPLAPHAQPQSFPRRAELSRLG